MTYVPGGWKVLPVRKNSPWAHRAVRLGGGAALIATEGGAVTWVEGADTEPTGPMQVTRMQLALVALPDGRGLAIGGRHGWKDPVLASCELFDPANRAWRPAPPLNHARAQHAAVISGERVFVMGGVGLDGSALASVEAWRPGDEEWSVLPHLAVAREKPKAVVLADGNVLVADGGVEIWDVRTESWRESRGGPSRTDVAVVARRVGGAAVVGGRELHGDPKTPKDVATVDVLSPAGEWTRGKDLPEPRFEHGALEMPDGTIAITGGSGTRSERQDSSDGGELDHEYRSFTTTGYVDRVIGCSDAICGTPEGEWGPRFGMEMGNAQLAPFDDTRVLVSGNSLCGCLLWKAV